MTTILDYPNELSLTETDPERIANLVRKGWVARPDKPEHDPETQQCVWTGTEWIISPYTPPPPPVPDDVPAHLLRRALRTLGATSLVQAYVDQLPADDPMRDDWEYAPYFRRSSVGVIAAAEALEWTSEQLDDVFRLAHSYRPVV